jgi:hypothetical protein
LQIQIEWDAITGVVETGGSQIISYRIDWDNSNGQTEWYNLIGEDTAYTGLSWTETGVTPGEVYNFRISV